MFTARAVTNHQLHAHATPAVIPARDPATTRAYMVGSGIASMASAMFLIREAKVPAKNITIYEESSTLGGALDGTGNPKEGGYVIRGGRMLNLSYVCLYDLLDSVPSIEKSLLGVPRDILEKKPRTAKDDIMLFTKHHPTAAAARLVDAEGKILPVHDNMGFSAEDRVDLMSILTCTEEDLGTKRIDQCFNEHFFTTQFWYMWATMFAFQPWHSAVEYKRYVHRFAHEFGRIDTLAGVDRTPMNQFDSIVLPVATHLKSLGVNFVERTLVSKVDFDRSVPHTITVSGLHLTPARGSTAQERVQKIEPTDLVFVTNGSMTSAASLGDTDKPAPAIDPQQVHKMDGAWKLWEQIAHEFPSGAAGNPSNFIGREEESNWMSFTTTFRGDTTFFDTMEKWSGNPAGSGALVTFKDSNWLMSVVLAAQPHFRDQPADVQVFWGYALFTNKPGDYIKKTMRECTGREIMEELMYHLRNSGPFADEALRNRVLEAATVVPVMMPYITAQFLTREEVDRPNVVPKGSTNLAFCSQFCEVPDDVVFTVEYSVRAARMAVVSLMGLGPEHNPPPVYKDKMLGSPAEMIKSLKTFFS
ncbi:oleate hydratase [Blastocladiella britannica]|nr:oleate hydratase [Blastocladiella britannica]